jgi:GH35 family endo-1,4-beta-xylanase
MSSTTPLGEEWKDVAGIDRSLFPILRSDAETLAAAREEIPRTRTRQVTLRLAGPHGPVPPGTPITVVQESHAFDFGCSSGSTLEAEASDPRIKARNDLFVALFNCTTAKCYWDENWHQPVERHQGQRVTSTFLAEIDWALARGLRVRGHPLVWTVPKAIPGWMRRYPYEQQLRFLEHHVRSLIACTGGRVKLWDLVNEMLWEPSLHNLPSRDWPHLESTEEMLTTIEPAVHWARSEDPDAVYVLNDYGLEIKQVALKGGVSASQQRDRFVRLVDEMQKRGCAPDAIGTQAHDSKWAPLDLFHHVFSQLASTGLPVQISEFWAHDSGCPQAEGKTPEQILEQKCDFVEGVMTVAFAHPSVTHFTYWGGAEFFTRDGWQPSKLYERVRDLIHHRWKTRTEVITGPDGEISFRGFLGGYRLRWTGPNGRAHSLPFRLDRQTPSRLEDPLRP